MSRRNSLSDNSRGGTRTRDPGIMRNVAPRQTGGALSNGCDTVRNDATRGEQLIVPPVVPASRGRVKPLWLDCPTRRDEVVR